MLNEIGFIKSIKQSQPDLWKAILEHTKTGLIVIDEQNDAVTATNRLLITYPDLHLTLSSLINSWNENNLQKDSELNFKNLIKDLKKETV